MTGNPNTQAYIGLGANLGSPLATLQKVLTIIQADSRVEFEAASSFYGSSPVDADGPDYVNAVVRIKTRLSALQLLDLLQKIELDFGRERPYVNAPRTLDLDLLLYGDETIQNNRLTIPHPRMHERAFVLVPLHEIAPDLRLEAGELPSLIEAALAQGQEIYKLN